MGPTRSCGLSAEAPFRRSASEPSSGIRRAMSAISRRSFSREIGDLAADPHPAVRGRIDPDDPGLDVDDLAGERRRDDEHVAGVKLLGGREADPGRRDVAQAHVQRLVARQRPAEEDAGLGALGDGDARRRPPHLAVADARDGRVHERLGGAVEVGLVDLELDLVAAALLVGDAGEQVELLAHLLPRRERVQELALLLDDAEQRRHRRPRTAPRPRSAEAGARRGRA